MAAPNAQFNGYTHDINRLVQKALEKSNFNTSLHQHRLKSKSYSSPSYLQRRESSSSAADDDSLYGSSSHLGKSSLSNGEPPKYSEVAGNYNHNGKYYLPGPLNKHPENSKDSLQDSSKWRSLPKPRNQSPEEVNVQVSVDFDKGHHHQGKKAKQSESRFQSHSKPAQEVKPYAHELESGSPFCGGRNKGEKLLTAALVVAVIIILVLALFVVLLALGIISARDVTTVPGQVTCTTAQSNTVPPPTTAPPTPRTAPQDKVTTTQRFVTIVWDERTATPTPVPPTTPTATGSTGSGSATSEKVFIIFDY